MRRTNLHIHELKETQSALADNIIITIFCLIGAYVGSIAINFIQNLMAAQPSPTLGFASVVMTLIAIICTAKCIVDTTIFLICRHKKQRLEQTIEKVAACMQSHPSI